MTAQQLKNTILQEAIQGRLVPQDPNDEPASALLERIRAEKQQLVKEGKLKKKDLEETPISEDEIPFEIPESWEWVRFGTITINRDSERIPLSVDERSRLVKKYDYYGASGVIDKVDRYLFNKPLLLIGEDGANLINRSTPIAFIARGEYWVNNHAHVLDYLNEDLMQYMCWYINAISLVDYVTGTAQPKMNQEKMNSILVALPPLAEQKRIVAKIEELLPKVEEYGKAQEKLNKLNEELPEKLKKSVLQEAIEGRLVPQDPNDEPASVLLDKIREEKKQLVKEGRLKKKDLEEKPISEDEKPFEIPESWEWVRLENITTYISRGKSPVYSEIQKYPIVAQKCNQWSGFSLEKAKFADPKTVEKYTEERLLRDGDLLWNSTGLGTLGRMAIYDSNVNQYGWAAADSHVTVIRTLPEFSNYQYLYYYFASNEVQSVIEDKSDGSTKQKELSQETVRKYLVPLPPLAEQKRIVAKIEQLLGEINKLNA